MNGLFMKVAELSDSISNSEFWAEFSLVDGYYDRCISGRYSLEGKDQDTYESSDLTICTPGLDLVVNEDVLIAHRKMAEACLVFYN
jgi:hypothetical protein